MQTQQRSPLSWAKRFVVMLAAVVSVLGVSSVASPAEATVYSSCTQTRCSAARSADATWESKGYPNSRGWYNWPNGQCNFAGGTFYNREGQLPSSGSYLEFDVYPRACGASRDAYRIVLDRNSGTVWFSPNHYTDFYRL